MAVPSRTKLLSSNKYEKTVLQSDNPLNKSISGKPLYEEGAFSPFPKRKHDLMMNMEPLEQTYYWYMITEHEMSENHALGMLANIRREVEDLDPKKLSGDKGGGPGGLFQWSKSSGRQTPKVAKMVKAGDWKAQIDYAIYEEDVYGKPGAYLKEKFKSAEDAEKWWRENWENPSDPEAEKKGKSHLKRWKKGVGRIYSLIDDDPLRNNNNNG